MFDNKIIELISEEVHNAWMEEKIKQGFHNPDDCRSSNHLSFMNTDCKNQERLTDLHNPKFYKWCDKCHTDLYPYDELPDNIKEYDRVTVNAVINAMDKVKSYFGIEMNDKSNNDWISINDYLPNEKQLCKLKVMYETEENKGEVIYFGVFNNGLWEINHPLIQLKFKSVKVTHWKPVNEKEVK